MFHVPALRDFDDDDDDDDAHEHKIEDRRGGVKRNRASHSDDRGGAASESEYEDEDEIEDEHESRHHKRRHTDVSVPAAAGVWKYVSESVAGIVNTMSESAEQENSIISVEDYYDVQKQVASANHLVNDGDKRLARVLRLMDSFKKKPTPGQRTFLNSYIDAVLPLIYGQCWDGSMMRVLRERRLRRIMSEVLVIASRQIGKTNAIAMFCAAMLLAVPGIRIGVYSTGTRASSHVSETVLEYLQDIPGAERRIIKNSKECVYVAEHPLPPGIGVQSAYAKLLESDAGTSQLMSYPDNATGTLRSHVVVVVVIVIVVVAMLSQRRSVVQVNSKSVKPKTNNTCSLHDQAKHERYIACRLSRCLYARQHTYCVPVSVVSSRIDQSPHAEPRRYGEFTYF